MTKEECDDEPTRNAILEEEKVKLENILSSYGKLGSVLMNLQPLTNKLFAFACFEKAEHAANVMRDYEEGKFKSIFPIEGFYMN